MDQGQNKFRFAAMLDLSASTLFPKPSDQLRLNPAKSDPKLKKTALPPVPPGQLSASLLRQLVRYSLRDGESTAKAGAALPIRANSCKPGPLQKQNITKRTHFGNSRFALQTKRIPHFLH
jgi:hypothetical protein